MRTHAALSGRVPPMAGKSPDQVKVGEMVSPPSLTYFASVQECRKYLENESSRERLEKKWRSRYATHRERTNERMKAQRAAQKASAA